MDFREFAVPLTRLAYSQYTTGNAVRQLFLDISNYDDIDVNPLYDISESTYRGYLQEGRGISRVAKLILPNLDKQNFATKMDGLPTDTVDLIIGELHSLIPSLDSYNFGDSLANQFAAILSDSQVRRGSRVNVESESSVVATSSFEADLFCEAGGKCPLCGASLSSSESEKRFKVVNITPLSVKCDYRVKREYESAVPQMPVLGSSEDRIVLCMECARDYSACPTRDRFRELVEAKHRMRSHEALIVDLSKIELERTLPLLLSRLGQVRDFEELSPLSMNALTIGRKIDLSNQLLRIKIEALAVRYYNFIREQLRLLEMNGDIDFEMLAVQIRTCYIKLKKANNDQEAIFNHICNWISEKSGAKSRVECEVVTAFFVQDCEVFDEVAK